MRPEGKTCVLVPASITVSLLTGALAGWYFTQQHHQREQAPPDRVPRKMASGAEDRETLLKLIQPEGIEETLKYLSSVPRVAGTEHSHKMAQWFQDQWQDMGLDSAGLEEYDVLLSYPYNMSHHNKVEILQADGRVKYMSPKFEKLLDPGQTNNPGMPPYSAFSKSGILQGDVVYVNNCGEQDLQYIEEALHINLTGKILMARYGGLIPAYRKMQIASSHKAAGLLLFSHPFTEAAKGADKVFPDTKWMPEHGVRRGAIITRLGDPLTHGYPAKDFSPRLSIPDAQSLYLSSIIVQPISYDTARQIFKAMDPHSPPIPDISSWKASVEKFHKDMSLSELEEEYNFYARIGGKMRNRQSVKLTVNNTLERRKIYNAHGVIQGAIEPDRFVIVGNHRDSWVYGAVDPAGGGAVMMELCKAMAKMMKQGWRPRRTIIFSSWDAEEFGVIGSTEWVEDKLKILSNKAVAYINIDIAVAGTSLLEASASPMLQSLIFDSATKISHPTFPSLAEAWRNQSITHSYQIPQIRKLTPNSDFSPFFFTAGIPSSNIYYSSAQGHGYPTYHSGYDTFHYVKKFVDPSFAHHACIGRLFGEMLRRLSDDEVLPLDPRGYAGVMYEALKWIRVSLYFSDKFTWLKNDGAHLIQRLESSVGNFSAAAEVFHAELAEQDITQAYVVRATNDRLMLMERAFIDNEWGAGSPYKHILLSPELNGVHIFGIGPGINDVLSDPEVQSHLKEHTLPPHIYRRIHDQFAILCFAIDTAAEILMV